MVAGAGRKIEAGAPRLVERVGRRLNHAGELLDAVQLAELGLGQGLLDRSAKTLIVDGTRKSASQPRGQMLECHHLKTVPAIAGGAQPDLAHGQSDRKSTRLNSSH